MTTYTVVATIQAPSNPPTEVRWMTNGSALSAVQSVATLLDDDERRREFGVGETHTPLTLSVTIIVNRNEES